MTKPNVKDRINALEEKLEKTKAQLREAQLKEAEFRRKRDTQRKIIMGGIFMREIAEGNKDAEKMFLDGLRKSSDKTQSVFPEYIDIAS